jgi:hypothetical protein
MSTLEKVYVVTGLTLTQHNTNMSIKRAGVNRIKRFWCKFTHTFCKIDHFINVNNNCYNAVKRSSLQSRVKKFMPKKFYEIDSSSEMIDLKKYY